MRKIIKVKPSVPHWVWFQDLDDNCWFCDNDRGCNNCKIAKRIVAEQKRRRRRKEKNVFDYE